MNETGKDMLTINASPEIPAIGTTILSSDSKWCYSQ